jgi:hypothetical protein
MPSKDADVSFSDREIELIRRVAEERGVSVEEVANELIHEAIAQKFKRGLNRQPAQVYSLRKR